MASASQAVAIVTEVLSRGVVLFQCLRPNSPGIGGLSLITQELFLLTYIARYLDLLALIVSIQDTLVKILRLGVALGIVLLIRYSPSVSETYERDLDVTPRAALLLPPFLLALFYHRYMMIVEIFHQFSSYLEPLALVPQYVMLALRPGARYPPWVLGYLGMAGVEGLAVRWTLLTAPAQALKADPYGLYAGWVLCVVLVLGNLALAVQALRARHTGGSGGLNESTNKPAFSEEWDGSRFTFVQDKVEAGQASGPVIASQGTQPPVAR